MTCLPGRYRALGVPDNWLVLGGRGSGKTRLGAEWTIAQACGLPPIAEAGRPNGRIALVGETLGDVREVMIDGPSGIRSVARCDRPRYEPTRRRLLWASGAVAYVFSSEDPESLRGPQFMAAWCDEAAKWKNAEHCFDMLQFGLRLGQRPKQLITTTPKPTSLIKRLMGDPAFEVDRYSTRDNAENLAEGFIAALEGRYAGTRLGRQELDGELIEDREDALWTRAGIEGAYLADMPELQRIVVAVDPPAGSRKTSDACGIVAAGIADGGRVVVLADESVRGLKPTEWAARAVALYHRLAADCIVAEVNQGGDMVAAVIRTVDASVAVKDVRAQRGKWLRAEPVAALYAQGLVRHAGRFPELEDEMCDFGPNGLSDGHSPDRLDALVWAVTDLLPRALGEPRIRDFG
ncbi:MULTISPECIES: DNA-packaging protein [Mesorhizobium]|uniref:ATP-binding protein n=1 Tax=Mesorhizobium denitrificans TaxID=2294114 RepID=A0A371XHQ2_9HYPH|nr:MULTISPECIES: terminase family protein [Mesorhizobium]RFC68765.1 ATP-binding protein [Mesorhizobium denitrificans]